jgi:hypothetical protein
MKQRRRHPQFSLNKTANSQAIKEADSMGKGIILWLLGIPIPIIILILLLWH